MGREKAETKKLPEGWLLRLHEFVRPKLGRQTIYEFVGRSPRMLAKAKKYNEMTVKSLQSIALKVGLESYRDLLRIFASGHQTPRILPSIPKSVSFVTQKSHPQGADYRHYSIEVPRPWTLGCHVVTGSPYFRFGFKLLGETGRLFGDGVIASQDENFLIHIGRNDWDRPKIGISATDVFWTAYLNGIPLDTNDRCLFSSTSDVQADLELSVDLGFFVSFVVNGKPIFRHVVSPFICRRVAIYAWGDREEFEVQATELSVRST